MTESPRSRGTRYYRDYVLEYPWNVQTCLSPRADKEDPTRSPRSPSSTSCPVSSLSVPTTTRHLSSPVWSTTEGTLKTPAGSGLVHPRRLRSTQPPLNKSPSKPERSLTYSTFYCKIKIVTPYQKGCVGDSTLPPTGIYYTRGEEVRPRGPVK